MSAPAHRVAPAQLHELISAAALRDGEAPALTHGGETLGYGELWRRTAAFGSALVAGGLAPGERVAVFLEKRVEAVIASFGASVAGGAFVPVNPLLKPEQVAHILADSGASVLVSSPERLALLADGLKGCSSLRRVIVTGGEPAAIPGLEAESTAWEELGGGGEGAGPAAGEASALAAILYTSGSTGRPKGVALSHGNLLAGAASVCEYLRVGPADRLLALLPLSFDAGFSQLTTGFLAGAQVVLLDYLLARDAVRACAEHRITGLTCVPPLWIALAEQEWPPEAAASMRYFANTGGRMPRATLERLRVIFPQAEPFLMYGLTEAFRSTYLDPSEVDRRPDSIGKAIPDAEVLVLREDGSECAPGEEGELVHRGPLVAMGYWNDSEASAERFRPAAGRDPAIPADQPAVWSGDRAVRDEDGFLYFVGRDDEMIKTSGYRVSPTEIEEVVDQTGLVADVVALGVDDPRLGQRVALAVSPADSGELDSEALLSRIRQRLPLFMLPKQVEVMPSLPRSPNGKLDRKAVRRALEGE